jgi:hypothetical protein
MGPTAWRARYRGPKRAVAVGGRRDVRAVLVREKEQRRASTRSGRGPLAHRLGGAMAVGHS